MNERTIKVGMFPGRLTEVSYMAGEITVGELLDMAEVSVKDEYEIKLDGETVNISDVITNGSRLLVSKRLKGAY